MLTRRRMLRLAALTVPSVALGQANPGQDKTPPPPTPTPDDAGPATTDNGTIIRKKKDAPEPEPAPAPAAPKIKNPNGENYSLRVDVPLVNLNVNVILDKTHQFVPGLKPANFLVLEDGVEQEVATVRITQTPITAVMLLEFAANSYALIQDMQNSAVGFYRSIRPDDYIAVITFDIRTHVLTDFTNNKDTVAQAIRSLILPTFNETATFDALYETLDRVSRLEGHKYVIMIGSGRDTISHITLDKILAKVKATPNVTIFTIGTGALAQELSGGRAGGGGGHFATINNLQAQNQLKTFAQMTGGLYFDPIFEGSLPDVFNQINDSIRNQYVLTYRPTNTKNDGSYRRVKVLLVDNEGKPLKMQDEKQKALKYTVVARDGYKAKLPVE